MRQTINHTNDTQPSEIMYAKDSTISKYKDETPGNRIYMPFIERLNSTNYLPGETNPRLAMMSDTEAGREQLSLRWVSIKQKLIKLNAHFEGLKYEPQVLLSEDDWKVSCLSAKNDLLREYMCDFGISEDSRNEILESMGGDIDVLIEAIDRIIKEVDIYSRSASIAQSTKEGLIEEGRNILGLPKPVIIRISGEES